jgi:hypothetical protein
MKILGCVLLATLLSSSSVFAEEVPAPQLLDVVLGQTITEEQTKCIQEKMVECETVGLPVKDAKPQEAENEVEKAPIVSRRRITRQGTSGSGKNQIIKLAVSAVPLSEVEQLTKCVTKVMTACSVTDYQITTVEQAESKTSDQTVVADEVPEVKSEVTETPAEGLSDDNDVTATDITEEAATEASKPDDDVEPAAEAE